MGAAGVALGAFGAHGLREVLEPGALGTWQTAVLYQLFHALALVATGLIAAATPGRAVHVAGLAFGLGILLFSGSLYLLALDGPRLLGPITPVGGVCFVAGWLALAWSQTTTRR